LKEEGAIKTAYGKYTVQSIKPKLNNYPLNTNGSVSSHIEYGISLNSSGIQTKPDFNT
jgi:hypothetical protein